MLTRATVPLGFPPRTAHAGLETVGAGAGQHLIDADDVVGVGAHAEVETFFAGGFDKVSVREICQQHGLPSSMQSYCNGG